MAEGVRPGRPDPNGRFDLEEGKSMEGRKETRLLKTGVIGSVVTMLCCFTPVLTFALGIAGLGAVTGYLDYVLLPAMAAFVGMTFYAIRRRRLARCGLCIPGDPMNGEGKGK